MTSAVTADLPVDVEAIRLPVERDLEARLASFAEVGLHVARLRPDPNVVRRELLMHATRMVEGSAPELYGTARRVLERFGLSPTVELYQSVGAGSAAACLVEAPVVIEIEGRLLPLLDGATRHALLGREVGHRLAHGAGAPGSALTGVVEWLADDGPTAEVRSQSRLLIAARQLTADRFALLATQDLAAVLLLEMVALTGVPADVFRPDTEVYLAQAKALLGDAAQPATSPTHGAHPLQSIRAYAAWLFSETDAFRRLTGKGPGSRSLADVNTAVARCLGVEASDAALAGRQEPPAPELHAAGLAGCVLVAAADGHVADEEVEAIEAAFGGLVPDAREYLDLSFARTRFEELRPVVAALGVQSHRALFAMLAHVAIADGVLEVSEVEAILALGKQINAGPLFRQLLLTLTERVGDQACRDALAKEFPAPVQTADGLLGLRTHLALLMRIGGGLTTLRRMLRLLGAGTRNAKIVETIRQEVERAGLTAATDVGRIELDAALTLSPRGAVPSRPLGRAAPASADVAALVRGITRLRDRLVSGDGRSPSVRLNGPRKGRVFDLASLEQVRIGQGERALAAVRSGKESSLIEAALIGTHEIAADLGAELLLLYREHRSRIEETGANDLAVGAPIISGDVEGYFVRGPLVLYPVDLVSSGKGARSFSLVPSSEREPSANQALIRQIFAKREFAYPDDLAAQLDELARDPTSGVERLLEELQRVGVAPTQFAQTLTTLGSRAGAQEAASKNSLHVEECAALGMFPQSGSDLLHDYDGLLRDLAAARRPAAQLLSSARALCPAHLRSMLAEDGAEEPMDERPIATVVSSDPSQFAVLEEVRRNMAMVVDGPPGTGKSQVIVNLVADAIARGKRVAVVSEKRAALDVVAARLSDCGLSDSFALVHDVETDRKRLYAKLAGRLEAEAAPKPSAEAKARATSAVAQIKVELRSRAACLAKPVDGDGPTVGQIHVLVSGADAARAGISVDLGRTSTLTLLSLREHLSELSPFAAHLEPKSIWARDRASLARWANEDLTAFLAHVRLATDTAASLESLSQKFPGASAQALLASQAGVAAAREVVQHWDKSDALLWSAALLSRGDRGFDLEAANLVRTHQEHGAALERFDERVFFQVAEDESAAIAIGLKWSSRFWRFLSTSWWRAKPVLAQLLLRASQPATISTASIRNLATRVQAARGWQAIEGAFEHLAPRHLLPSRSSELGAFLRRMHSCTASVRGALSHRRVLSSISLWPQVSSLASSEGLTQAEQQLRSWAAQIELVRSIINALQEHRETAKPVADALPWLTALPPRDSLVEVARNFELDGVRLITMDRLLEAARTAHPEAPKLASWLADQSHGQAHDWPRCVTEAWGRARLRAVETEDPSVRALDGLTTRGEEADAGRELRKAETSVVEMTRRGLRAALDSTALRSVAQADKGARRTEDQKAREAILKECRKQRNLMPLRTFTRTFARQGALETLPVWLVSPETLSVLFEREPVFDCIIVDEASQVTVENGLPALLRGKRVVIAGDDKQMPPTSFFSAKTDDPDDEATDEADEETADAFSGESLLTLARSRCPHRGLAWHYRCVDEDLIAFSNHAMYAAGLYTIPSAGATVAGPAIRWESVAAGAFVKGRNVAEAERVVDVLDELLCRPVAPSVGVVTFNLQQKQAVLDAIDARRAASPEFARRIDAAMAAERIDERPFVKNLENVQGDERDVIVFSLGYAPAERTLKNGSVNRSVPARFGPLGLRGGERRLNVAISRAKRETVIVCSFEPELLSVAKTRNVGPRLLKEFLVFAKLSADGHRARAHSVLERVSEGTSTGAVRKARKLPLPGYLPLPIQLGEALAKRGHAWEAYVGRSRFQIPLAVAHSSDPSRYLVAVLTDEGDEPEVGVFERWVHRVRMLEARGWQVLLVHAREWLRGPDQVLLRIEASLERAQYLAQTAKTRDAAPAPVDTPVTVSTMGTARAPVAWADAFRTEELKSVFRHIETHGALGEEELVAMLGSPRAYRRFCVDIEDHLAKTPFGVRIDVVNGTKRYVREAKGS